MDILNSNPLKISSELEVMALLDIICFGRPYSPEQVWKFIEAEDVEELLSSESTIFNLMGDLDRAEAKCQALGEYNSRPLPAMWAETGAAEQSHF